MQGHWDEGRGEARTLPGSDCNIVPKPRPHALTPRLAPLDCRERSDSSNEANLIKPLISTGFSLECPPILAKRGQLTPPWLSFHQRHLLVPFALGHLVR